MSDSEDNSPYPCEVCGRVFGPTSEFVKLTQYALHPHPKHPGKYASRIFRNPDPDDDEDDGDTAWGNNVCIPCLPAYFDGEMIAMRVRVRAGEIA